MQPLRTQQYDMYSPSVSTCLQAQLRKAADGPVHDLVMASVGVGFVEQCLTAKHGARMPEEHEVAVCFHMGFSPLKGKAASQRAHAKGFVPVPRGQSDSFPDLPSSAAIS